MRQNNTLSRLLKLALLSLVSVLSLMSFSGRGQERGRALLQEKCAVCHQPNEQGQWSRISFQRKTPEGWDMTISRMERAQGVRLTAEEKRALIQYLSQEQGLAPAEVRDFAYLVERRDWLIEQIQDPRRQTLCARCHSYARVALQRRTLEEWELLIHFHLGAFPTIEYQSGGRNIAWLDEALQEAKALAREFPLESEAWQKWRRQPRLSLQGTWRVVGYQPGKGRYAGQVVLTSLGQDRYRELLTWEFEDGSKITGQGSGLLYTGFGWRGSVKLDDGRRLREVLHLSEDGQTLTGRWFLPPHDELGGDQTLYLIGREPRVLAVSPASVQRSTGPVRLQVWGMNFPAVTQAADVSLGKGIVVDKIIRADAQTVVVEARIEERAELGTRTVSVGPARGVDVLTVYDRIDYIKIEPEKALARTGGTTAPKQLQQFEAIAFNRGPDGLPGTADDWRLGPVPAKWAVKEFHSTSGDEDARFVGSVDQTGLFTPADEGPNPQRRFQANNVGDVWVEATVEQPDGQPLRARAYLIVTVPRWVKPPLR